MSVGGLGSNTPPVIITDYQAPPPGGEEKPAVGPDGKPLSPESKDIDKEKDTGLEGSNDDGGEVLLDADGNPIEDQTKTEGGGAGGGGTSDGDGSSKEDSGKSVSGGTGAVGGSSGVSGVQLQGAQELDLHALIETDFAPTNGTLTALSVPQIAPPPQMGNLSTSELIQIVRTRARETAQLLIKATATVIEAQKLEIKAKAEGKIKDLNESIKKQEEAQKMKESMDILKYVMYAISAIVIAVMAVAAVVSAVFTGGATLAILATVSALLLVATVMATEIKDDEGKSGMDKGMEEFSKFIANAVADMVDFFGPLLEKSGMAEAFGITIASVDPESAEMKQGSSIAAAAIMASVQIAIAVVMAVASFGGAAGASVTNAVGAAGRAAATIVNTALKAAADIIMSALKISMETMKTIMNVAKAMMVVLNVVQALSTIASSSTKIAIAVKEYEASSKKADIEELKAMIKMLQALLEQDSQFLKDLMEIQSKLDQGVSTIMRNEHETSLKIENIQQLA
jgi:hypothetical protein